MRLKMGNWYRFNHNGTEYIGQYTGTDNQFECCVCGKGHKAKCFNIWYKSGEHVDYETWGFGDKHLPTLTEYADDKNLEGKVIIGEGEETADVVTL